MGCRASRDVVEPTSAQVLPFIDGEEGCDDDNTLRNAAHVGNPRVDSHHNNPIDLCPAKTGTQIGAQRSGAAIVKNGCAINDRIIKLSSCKVAAQAQRVDTPYGTFDDRIFNLSTGNSDACAQKKDTRWAPQIVTKDSTLKLNLPKAGSHARFEIVDSSQGNLKSKNFAARHNLQLDMKRINAPYEDREDDDRSSSVCSSARTEVIE